MLLSPIVHPQLLKALSNAREGNRIRVVDNGNYAPIGNPSATTIHLNLSPGVLPASTIIPKVAETIHIRSFWTPRPQDPIAQIAKDAGLSVGPAPIDSGDGLGDGDVVIVTGDVDPIDVTLMIGRSK